MHPGPRRAPYGGIGRPCAIPHVAHDCQVLLVVEVEQVERGKCCARRHIDEEPAWAAADGANALKAQGLLEGGDETGLVSRIGVRNEGGPLRVVEADAFGNARE